MCLLQNACYLPFSDSLEKFSLGAHPIWKHIGRGILRNTVKLSQLETLQSHSRYFFFFLKTVIYYAWNWAHFNMSFFLFNSHNSP